MGIQKSFFYRESFSVLEEIILKTEMDGFDTAEINVDNKRHYERTLRETCHRLYSERLAKATAT